MSVADWIAGASQKINSLRVIEETVYPNSKFTALLKIALAYIKHLQYHYENWSKDWLTYHYMCFCYGLNSICNHHQFSKQYFDLRHMAYHDRHQRDNGKLKIGCKLIWRLIKQKKIDDFPEKEYLPEYNNPFKNLTIDIPSDSDSDSIDVSQAYSNHSVENSGTTSSCRYNQPHCHLTQLCNGCSLFNIYDYSSNDDSGYESQVYSNHSVVSSDTTLSMNPSCSYNQPHCHPTQLCQGCILVNNISNYC